VLVGIFCCWGWRCVGTLALVLRFVCSLVSPSGPAAGVRTSIRRIANSDSLHAH
jgi:hypothetical protein